MSQDEVMAADAAAIRKFLSRFNKDGLVDVASAIGVELTPTMKGLQKGKLLDEVVATFGQGIKFSQLAIADLLYLRTHTSKRWQALKVFAHAEGGTPIRTPSSCSELAAKLRQALKAYFRHHLHGESHDGVTWLRLVVRDSADVSQLMSASNTFYLVSLPHSPYFLISPLKKEYRDFIYQALLSVSGAAEVREMDLVGKDVAALKAMLLSAKSQGAYSALRLGQRDTNPLGANAAKRVKLDEGLAAAGGAAAESKAIVVENAAEVERRRGLTVETFGSNPQPVLQKVEFEMRTRYKTGSYAIDGPFLCKAKFEGTSVIDGVKQLVPAGAAVLPLPPHLAELHSTAKSNFVLKDAVAE